LSLAAEILRDEIQRRGPIPFSRFMDIALYHPEAGYYRRGDVFGMQGDFYTAEQIQPVFGLLMRRVVRRLLEGLRAPAARLQVVELGAGRREMAGAFAEWEYVPVDFNSCELPEQTCGLVFANEFFDALPVEVVQWDGRAYRRMRVHFHRGRFCWWAGEPVDGELLRYLETYAAPVEPGHIIEVGLEALRWMDRVASSLRLGFLLVIDYGYENAERIRFPEGTLMSYRRHRALDDVLQNPGRQDITAHVNFTALREYAASQGLKCRRFESLAQLLLRAGEEDEFAEVLSAEDPRESMRRRLQLKTLLFGMGESFRALLMERENERQ
jgi:SAM-dependent MidA family methyltransferase